MNGHRGGRPGASSSTFAGQESRGLRRLGEAPDQIPDDVTADGHERRSDEHPEEPETHELDRVATELGQERGRSRRDVVDVPLRRDPNDAGAILAARRRMRRR